LQMLRQSHIEGRAWRFSRLLGREKRFLATSGSGPRCELLFSVLNNCFSQRVDNNGLSFRFPGWNPTCTLRVTKYAQGLAQVNLLHNPIIHPVNICLLCIQRRSVSILSLFSSSSQHRISRCLSGFCHHRHLPVSAAERRREGNCLWLTDSLGAASQSRDAVRDESGVSVFGRSQSRGAVVHAGGPCQVSGAAAARVAMHDINLF
jgi:hypothetical protein